MKMPEPGDFPIAVKQGSCTVKIYRQIHKGYVGFKVAYYDSNGRRKVQTFADYQKAHKEAKKKVESLATGNLNALTLTNEDALIYLRATSAVNTVGVPLDVAAREFTEAKKLLQHDSLLDAVRTFLKSHRVATLKTVREVVDELIQEKETLSKRPASEDYIKDLRLRLGKFAEAFHCEIRNIGPDEMRQFLGSRKKAKGRTRFNYARVIRTLFRFAQARRYYPRDLDPFEGIDLQFADDGEIEIFTPEELSRLFEVARPEIIPFLALGAFAGLRHREITRLDWQEVLPSGYIEIKKSKAKVRSRRLVPITENLAQWLAIGCQDSGPVCGFANMTKQLLWLADATKEKEPNVPLDAAPLKVKWKHNALRHSFISYRLAILGDENRVAMEAGNSPAMIYRNYRQLVTKEQAERWFAIKPGTDNNIIPFQIESTAVNPAEPKQRSTN